MNEKGKVDNRNKGKGKVKKCGRRSTWQQSHITDMVDLIVNDEDILKKLVFTNIKKSKNTDCYEKVLVQLNMKYQETTGNDFPFTVQQMRVKFKWCISVCKRICLTIKTASGVNNFVADKGYGDWFNLLYPLVKFRDSCQPERASEPSAKKPNKESESNTSGKDDDDDDLASGLDDPLGEGEPADKSMFVPVKGKGTLCNLQIL